MLFPSSFCFTNNSSSLFLFFFVLIFVRFLFVLADIQDWWLNLLCTTICFLLFAFSFCCSFCSYSLCAFFCLMPWRDPWRRSWAVTYCYFRIWSDNRSGSAGWYIERPSCEENSQKCAGTCCVTAEQSFGGWLLSPTFSGKYIYVSVSMSIWLCIYVTCLCICIIYVYVYLLMSKFECLYI